MCNHRALLLTLFTSALLGSCSSMPLANSTLDQAHADYSDAQANPGVAQFAGGELRLANDALLKADTAWRNREDSGVVTHLAYVARQQVAIAQQSASQRADEQAIVNAGAERDRARLAARTREADDANRNAANAQRLADASQRQSEASQRNAEALQRQSDSSLRAAEASQRAAAAATQTADDANLSAQAAGQRTVNAEQRAGQLESQLRDMEARQMPRGMVITLGDVLFNTNEARLNAGGMRSAQKLADFFAKYPQRKVMIEGFTDSTGSSNRNHALSEDRAASVRMALLDMGVSAGRIESRGYGEAYPVASNDTNAGRQLNRRVEIIISDDRGVIAPR